MNSAFITQVRLLNNDGNGDQFRFKSSKLKGENRSVIATLRGKASFGGSKKAAVGRSHYTAQQQAVLRKTDEKSRIISSISVYCAFLHRLIK
jgi:hypothetical protein